RRQADGTLIFLGRADRQVKIRGFRIEPGEIQAALLAHDGVDAAAVIARDGQLLAYVSGAEHDDAVLRRHLAQRLPDYMLPAIITPLAALPLTANGKLDEAALPRPARQGAAYRAPESEAERLLCQLMAEVLGVERVGPDDNFFALGGDSLSATRLLARLRAGLAPTLGLDTLFQAACVSELARHCHGAGPAGLPIAVTSKTRARLSFAQERLWFLDQLQGDSREYHIPDARRLRGPLDAARLTQALNAVVARHASLRTYFVQENGAVRQAVRPLVPLSLPLVDLSLLGETERQAALRQAMADEWETRFDLGAGPLLRASLLRLAPDDHVLLRTCHHLIADGWSMALFERELWHCYQNDALAPLPLQYPDFAEYQRDHADTDAVALAYWRRQLSGAPALLTLASDRPRPPVQHYQAGWVRARLDGAVMRDMARLLADAPGTTPYMVLLALWALLLGRESGQDDVVIGSPCASRPFAALESVIGLFVNTLALRVRLAQEQSFAMLLAQVRQTCLDAYRHQDVPFERLVEALAPRRDLGHAPLFQAMLAMQNLPDPATPPAELTVEALTDQVHKVRFDVELHVQPNGDALELCWIYKRELFDTLRVTRWSERFERLAAQALAAPDTRLEELGLLSDAERHAVVELPNQTRAAIAPQPLHALFEASAQGRPEALALSGHTL
ncbi:condensation domain-containing protein, partial [Paludibacterium sp.]|uniref:condensation domain-containing protein n=1 Tax=Paludibacterium sp. TaxID=1917523 RepID=UPI0025EF8CEA